MWGGVTVLQVSSGQALFLAYASCVTRPPSPPSPLKIRFVTRLTFDMCDTSSRRFLYRVRALLFCVLQPGVYSALSNTCRYAIFGPLSLHSRRRLGCWLLGCCSSGRLASPGACWADAHGVEGGAAAPSGTYHAVGRWLGRARPWPRVRNRRREGRVANGVGLACNVLLEHQGRLLGEDWLKNDFSARAEVAGPPT